MVKGKDGKLEEQVYRAGTPDGKVPPGLYAVFLKKANDCFEKASAYAEPAQAGAIAHLVRYYQTETTRNGLPSARHGFKTMPRLTSITDLSRSIATLAARKEVRRVS